jgi:hypothetical protein
MIYLYLHQNSSACAQPDSKKTCMSIYSGSGNGSEMPLPIARVNGQIRDEYLDSFYRSAKLVMKPRSVFESARVVSWIQAASDDVLDTIREVSSKHLFYGCGECRKSFEGNMRLAIGGAEQLTLEFNIESGCSSPTDLCTPSSRVRYTCAKAEALLRASMEPGGKLRFTKAGLQAVVNMLHSHVGRMGRDKKGFPVS